MNLYVDRLTPVEARATWVQFYYAHGSQVMYDAYGWESARDRRMLRDEVVFRFASPADAWKVVGWGSVRFNEIDPTEVNLACGIFPEFERRGFRMQIRDWMAEWSKHQGAKVAIVQVYKDNVKHYDRCLAETKTNSPWIYAGDVWFPVPGYGLFVRDLCPETEAAEAAKEAA